MVPWLRTELACTGGSGFPVPEGQAGIDPPAADQREPPSKPGIDPLASAMEGSFYFWTVTSCDLGLEGALGLSPTLPGNSPVT